MISPMERMNWKVKHNEVFEKYGINSNDKEHETGAFDTLETNHERPRIQVKG